MSLRQFATPRQIEYLDAIEEHGTHKKAADALGINVRTLQRALASLKDKAALRGYAPENDMTKVSAPGYMVKGTSTLYDEEGQPRLQWVKTSVDQETRERVAREALEALTVDLKPYKPMPAPRIKTDDALANVFIVTDYHLGMRAWSHETRGDDWDMEIAERLLVEFFSQSIKLSPKAHTAVLANMGDFMHWDGLDSLTPQNKNPLDHDTRFEKLVGVAIGVIRRVIGLLLESHQQVLVIMAEGNHDPASSVWLRQTFHALFDNEPRVTIDLDHDTYYCFEWGETSVFFHHGHKRKLANVDSVFAAKFRRVFGRTRHSYGHLGHLHNKQVVESNLMLVEQHRTLASPDAYASRGGWISGRSAPVITYHKKHGEVARQILTPEMLDVA